MMTPNFIPTSNPFNLRIPPDWFLKQLYAYDTMLVIFPSEKEPCYRMGRRGKNGHGLLTALNSNPDTKVFVDNRVWPWKSVLPESVGMNWARVLLELPEFDTQRFKDPGAQLDGVEEAAERALERAIEDEADQRAIDFYRTLNLIGGSRVGAGRRAEGAGYKPLGAATPRANRRRVHRPTASGAGAIWSGR